MVVRRRAANAAAVEANTAKPRIKAWSFSTLTQYRKCPKLVYFTKVRKIKEPESAPMLEGQRVHKLCEDFVLGRIAKLPKELAKFAAEFATLVTNRKYVKAEAEITFTNQWIPTHWRDWDNAWVRIKVDALKIVGSTATVIDYKNGKEKDDDLEQLDLYALAVFETEPSVDEVHVELWYLQSGEILGTDPEKPYRRADVAKLKKKWTQAPAKMLADETFTEKPGNHCGFCFFGQAGKAKGGPGLCPR